MTGSFVENGKEDILLRIGKATTLPLIATILADIQWKYGFRGYFVFDASRSFGHPLGQLLHPSNLPETLIDQLDDAVENYATDLFGSCFGAFSPVPWNIDNSIGSGRLKPHVANILRDAQLTMGVSFPAMGISGMTRIIGFVGARKALSDDDVDQLNFLMIQIHAKISAITPESDAEAQPLTQLEKQTLALAAEGYGASAIACELNLSTRTIQYLMASLCRKMQVATMEHAVAMALRMGFIA